MVKVGFGLFFWAVMEVVASLKYIGGVGMMGTYGDGGGVIGEDDNGDGST